MARNGKRLKKRKIPDSAIQREIADDGRLLEFSFKHLDFDDPKFNSENCDSAYLCSLLLRIKDYSNYRVGQFIDFNHQSDRNTIDPERLREHLAHKGIDEQLLDSQAWEIRVDPTAKTPPRSLWRVFGLLIGNVLYLILLDPQHRFFESHHPKHKQASGKR